MYLKFPDRVAFNFFFPAYQTLEIANTLFATLGVLLRAVDCSRSLWRTGFWGKIRRMIVTHVYSIGRSNGRYSYYSESIRRFSDHPGPIWYIAKKPILADVKYRLVSTIRNKALSFAPQLLQV